MQNMLSNANKKFFALVKEENFSFQNKNFLHNCYDIDLEYSIINEVERGVQNNLINLDFHKDQKLKIHLSGLGNLQFMQMISEPFYLVTSQFIMPYSRDNKRNIMFDYFFEYHQMPLEDQAPNKNSTANLENLYFIPIIRVYIKGKNVKFSNSINANRWSLNLEEI